MTKREFFLISIVFATSLIVGAFTACSGGGSGGGSGIASVLGQPNDSVHMGVAKGFYYPAGVHYGGGKYALADSQGNRVLIWNSAPQVGGTPDLVLGQTTPYTNGSYVGVVSASTMSLPLAVWTDGNRLVVCDSNNNRVLVWNTFPTINGQPADFALGQPAGASNLTSSSSNNGGVSGSSISGCTGVFSTGSQLFVADSGNNRVLSWASFPTAPVAADFALGQANLTSNASGTTASSMSSPVGLTVTGGKLYVADSNNNRVLVWNTIPSATAPASFALGQPSGGSNLTSGTANNGGVSGSSMQTPQGLLAVGAQLFVADAGNNRVLAWNARPNVPTAANFVLGQSNLTSNSPGATAVAMNYPVGLASDGTHLLVADQSSHRLLIWASMPSASTPADAAVGQRPGADNLLLANSFMGGDGDGKSMYGPAGVWSDGTRVIVVDYGNSRVLVWNTLPVSDGQSADFALGQPAGATNLTSTTQGGGADGMAYPLGVVVVGNKLFVADNANNRVLVWNSVPTSPSSADFALGQPAGAANLTSATANNGGISATSLNGPTNIWTDGTKLFVADSANNRVLVWNSVPNSPGPADFVLGQPNMTSNTFNNGGVSGSSLASPYAGYVGGGKLFVVDLSNHRVLVWNAVPSTTAAPADFALGQTSLTAATFTNFSATTMGYPLSIHGDGIRLYVADSTASRVLVWNSLPTTMGEPASSVLGQSDFTSFSNNAGGELSGLVFNFVQGIWSTGSHLFVCDRRNSRVVILPE